MLALGDAKAEKDGGSQTFADTQPVDDSHATTQFSEKPAARRARGRPRSHPAAASHGRSMKLLASGWPPSAPGSRRFRPPEPRIAE
jgi:hypothetical protein